MLHGTQFQTSLNIENGETEQSKMSSFFLLDLNVWVSVEQKGKKKKAKNIRIKDMFIPISQGFHQVLFYLHYSF